MTISINLAPIIPPSGTIQIVRGFGRIPFVGQLITEQLQGIHPGRIHPREQVAALAANSLLVHVTPFLPVNGRVLARNRYQVPENRLDPRFHELFTQSLSVVRPTVHFTPNGVVPEHKQQHPVSSEKTIVILQPTKQSQISGGYLEDIFCVGSQLLPKDSSIVVPDAFRHHPHLATLPETIKVLYRDKDETVRAAVKRVLDHLRVEHLSPISVRDPEDSIFVFKDSETKAILVADWMHALSRPLCSHDITPTHQIEILLLNNPILSIPPFSHLF